MNIICNVKDRANLTLRLTQLMEGIVGKPVQCWPHRELCLDKRRSRKTDYIHFGCNEVPDGLFVKYGRRLRYQPAIERFLTRAQFDYFRAPTFFGDGRIDQMMFGVWEYIPNAALEDFSGCTDEQLLQIVLSAAEMAAATPRVIEEVPGIRSKTSWVNPVASDLRDALARLTKKTGEQTATIGEELELLSKIELKALSRIEAAGEWVFTHNDFSPSNTIFYQQQFFVLDWERAYLSVAGSGLRNLSFLPMAKQKAASIVFAEHLKKSGLFVKADDILFAMGAVQLFYMLRMALSVDSFDHIAKGLKFVRPLLADRL